MTTAPIRTTTTATITRDALAAMLRDSRGATFATLTVRTSKKLLKKSRETGEPQPCPAVDKVARVNVTIGHDYEWSVNRSLARRGEAADFQARDLPAWQEHAGGPMRRHKASGKLYVAVKVERVYSTSYLDPPATCSTPRPWLVSCRRRPPARSPTSPTGSTPSRRS